MRILGLLSGVILLLCMLCGCGGSRGGGSTGSGHASGRAICAVLWPEDSRLVPIASKSVRVEFLQEDRVIAERLLVRPASGGRVSAVVENLPVTTLIVRATAYPQADGTGTALATGSVSIQIRANEVVPVTLTMDSTIARLEIAPNNPTLAVGNQVQLTMTARDAEDNIVLTTPTKIQWKATGVAASVNASGMISTLTAGTATITVTEQESDKSASIVVTVSGSSSEDTAIPITLTGFNLDVIFEAQARTTAFAFDDTTTTWIENGIQDYPGLPAGPFVSRLPNPITTGTTTYQLQPFTQNNVLALTEESTQGTLSLAVPTRYRTLSIAAASSNARFVPGNGVLILNFEDGSTSDPISYNARDWWGEGGNDDPNRIFESGLYRAENAGTNVLMSSIRMDTIYRYFNLYETTIDLSNIGGVDYTQRKLRSVTFQRAEGVRLTGIFAISGIALSL